MFVRVPVPVIGADFVSDPHVIPQYGAAVAVVAGSRVINNASRETSDPVLRNIFGLPPNGAFVGGRVMFARVASDTEVGAAGRAA
ncbi:hypothetical protein JCM33774_47340 [Actinophytocola sp. KF-1]